MGIEAEDVFAPDFLRRLDQVTKGLSALPNLDHVLSISNVADFQADPMGGVIAGMLVDTVPQTSEAQAALRAKVLSRDHIRGSLVSDDGTAVVLVAFAAYRADPQQVAGDMSGSSSMNRARAGVLGRRALHIDVHLPDDPGRSRASAHGRWPRSC